MNKNSDAFISETTNNFYYNTNINNRLNKFYTIHNQSFGTGVSFADSKATSPEADRSCPSSDRSLEWVELYLHFPCVP